MALTQHFVAVWSAFLVFAFISALPRGIALLALSTQAPTGIREMLEEEAAFGDIMAGCRAADQVWTGLSQGGRFHKWMIIADYACYYSGSFVAFSASVYATFPAVGRASTAASRFIVILAVCNLSAGIASAVEALGSPQSFLGQGNLRKCLTRCCSRLSLWRLFSTRFSIRTLIRIELHRPAGKGCGGV